MIQRKKLIKPISLEGDDFWGKPAKITFVPANQKGWFLQTKKDGVIPIDFRIAKRRKGRIDLESGGTILSVYEHIGALRFAGIDGVRIITETRWPPYLGGMMGYLPAFLLSEYTKDDGIISTIKPKRRAEYNSYNTLQSQTAIRPATRLCLTVQAQWKPLPHYVETFATEELSEEQWMEIWNAKPQGTLLRKRIARFLHWPNMNYVAWIDSFNSKEEAAYAWWLHRVQDILGCLSLASHTSLPVLKYESFCAGHKEDLEVLKQAFS